MPVARRAAECLAQAVRPRMVLEAEEARPARPVSHLVAPRSLTSFAAAVHRSLARQATLRLTRLIVVDGSPDVHVRDLRRVVTVIKGGTVHSAASLETTSRKRGVPIAPRAIVGIEMRQRPAPRERPGRFAAARWSAYPSTT